MFTQILVAGMVAVALAAIGCGLYVGWRRRSGAIAVGAIVAAALLVGGAQGLRLLLGISSNPALMYAASPAADAVERQTQTEAALAIARAELARAAAESALAASHRSEAERLNAARLEELQQRLHRLEVQQAQPATVEEPAAAASSADKQLTEEKAALEAEIEQLQQQLAEEREEFERAAHESAAKLSETEAALQAEVSEWRQRLTEVKGWPRVWHDLKDHSFAALAAHTPTLAGLMEADLVPDEALASFDAFYEFAERDFAARRVEIEAHWKMTGDLAKIAHFTTLAGNRWPYGNAVKLDDPGCVRDNETLAEPIVGCMTQRDFLSAPIGCCTDYAILMAELLTRAGYENRWIVGNGHLFNEVTAPVPMLVDANTGVIALAPWEDVLARVDDFKLYQVPLAGVSEAFPERYRPFLTRFRQAFLMHLVSGGYEATYRHADDMAGLCYPVDEQSEAKLSTSRSQ